MARPRNFLLAVLVLVCLASLWLARGGGWPLGGRNSAREEGPPGDMVANLEPVHLRVLNSTDQAGLAAEVALLLPAMGCVVEGVGNATSWPDTPSLLINRRLDPDRARELAQLLAGIPVLREWDGRTSEDAVLVLGQDHQRVLAGLQARQK